MFGDPLVFPLRGLVPAAVLSCFDCFYHDRQSRWEKKISQDCFFYMEWLRDDPKVGLKPYLAILGRGQTCIGDLSQL